MEKLVSIITPTYNYGRYISQLLDSVVSQTYPNMEMFVIDDGSTDNTKEVVEPYIKKFADTGKKLQYIYQENGGQSSAINNGLKRICGEYLVWVDADDWYELDTAIADMIEVFERSPKNVGIVRAMQYIRDENTFEIIGENGDFNIDYPSKLFHECLFVIGIGYWFTPGAAVVKTATLFGYYPDKKIYQDVYLGQNWQLLLPILYDYDCVTLKKRIINVRQNTQSDSRKKKPYGYRVQAFDKTVKMVAETLRAIKSMPKSEFDKLVEENSLRYDILRVDCAFDYKQKTDFQSYYQKILAKNPDVARKYKTKLFFSKIPFGFSAYELLCKIKSLSKRVIRKVFRIIRTKK